MFSSCSSDRSLTEETEETPLDRRRSRSGPRAGRAGRRLRSRHSDSRGPAPPHTAPSGCAPPPAWGCTSPGIPVPPHRYPLRSRSRHRSLRTEVSVREMLIKEEGETHPWGALETDTTRVSLELARPAVLTEVPEVRTLRAAVTFPQAGRAVAEHWQTVQALEEAGWRHHRLTSRTYKYHILTLCRTTQSWSQGWNIGGGRQQ